MHKIDIKDLEIIKEVDVSMSVLKHYIYDILSDSEKFSVHIKNIDAGTGDYQIVLQGRLKLNEIVDEIYI